VKKGASTLGDLRVTGEPRQWLVRFVDVVHDCWTKRGLEMGLLDALLPDQMGSLRSTTELSRDGGIPDILKDIAEGMGLAVRARLLDAQLGEVARQLGIDRFGSAIAKAIPGELSESKLTKDCLQALQTKLKEEASLSEDNGDLVRGSIRFLDYLWQTHGQQAREMATEVPLLSSDHTIGNSSNREAPWGGN